MIKTVVILIMVCIAAITSTILIAIHNKHLKDDATFANAKYKEAALQLGEATNKLGDANKKVSELSDQLQSEIKSGNEKATKYTELEAKYNVVVNQIPQSKPVPIQVPPSSTEVPLPEGLHLTPGHYYFVHNNNVDSAQALDLGGAFSVPYSDDRIDITTALFTIQDKSNLTLPSYQTGYSLHLKLRGQIVETINPKGEKNTYAELYEIDKDGNDKGKFQLTNFTTVSNDQRKKHFQLWNPHIDAGVIGGFNGALQLGGSIGVSVMSYGLTDNDLTWRFIRPGVALTGKGAAIDFSPVLYNIGEPLPLVSNLWVGPYINYDFKNLGAGLMFNLVL